MAQKVALLRKRNSCECPKAPTMELSEYTVRSQVQLGNEGRINSVDREIDPRAEFHHFIEDFVERFVSD